MERIKNQEQSPKRLALQSLAWIVHAKRPLLIEELRQALATRSNQSKSDEAYLPNAKRLLSVCAGLVRLDKRSQVVHLMHKTTQDYFQTTRKTWFPDAKSDTTVACVTYPSFHTFQSGYCQSDCGFIERLRLNKFYDYAAHNWGLHARTTSILCQEVIEFLRKEAQVEASNQALLADTRNRFIHKGHSQYFTKKMKGLHLAAYFRITDAVQILIDINPDLKDSSGTTSLLYAAKNGHEAVVQLLLDKGAEVNARDKDGQTLLQWAVMRNLEAIIRLLLDKEAEVDVRDDKYRTPLLYAASYGHKAVVKLLHEKGYANANQPDRRGHTPLSRATLEKHEAIVKMLLEISHADADQATLAGRRPLSWAAEEGYEAIAKQLILAGANINARDTY